MRTFVTVLLATGVVACCCLATRPYAAQADRSAALVERVEFYDVPLMCPAAKGLGCGLRAKPVLLALERDRSVDEAWLDRTGRTLAIVWKAGTTRPGEAIIAAVSETEKVAVVDVGADARGNLAESFRAGTGLASRR